MSEAKKQAKKYLDKKIIVGGVVSAILVTVLTPVLKPWTDKIAAKVDKLSPTTGGGVGTAGTPTGEEEPY